jgi:hypothetical protein
MRRGSETRREGETKCFKSVNAGSLSSKSDDLFLEKAFWQGMRARPPECLAHRTCKLKRADLNLHRERAIGGRRMKRGREGQER